MALNEAKKAQLTEEIEQSRAADTVHLSKVHIEEKNNKNRRLRCHFQIERDDQLKTTAQIAKQNAHKMHQNSEAAENLAYEMSRLKRNEIVELKHRQLIRQNSPELRELERKLRAAYASKELQAQIAEKQAQIQQEKLTEEEHYKKLQLAWIDEAEAKRRDAEVAIHKKAEYLHQLQDQMITNESTRRYRYDEFLREKQRIDDVIRRIQQEDERTEQQRRYNMQKTKEAMDAFKTARQIWRQREKDRIEGETQQSDHYNQFKEANDRARLMQRKQLQQQRLQVSETVAKQIADIEEKRQERDSILQALYEAERRENDRQREREEQEHLLQQKWQVKRSLERQIAEKVESHRRDAEDDSRFKQQLLEKLAAEEKLEQLSAEKKRLKMIQLRKDAEEMMKARRQKRAEEMQETRELELQAGLELQERDEQMNVERLRMLQEHGKHLRGHLASGILRSDDPDFFN